MTPTASRSIAPRAHPRISEALERSLQVGAWTRGVRLVAVCAAIALLSLALLPSVPSYDPYAWITWGREFLHMGTNGGPSWKPFPVFFTVPFALFGSFAPLLWIALVRTAGLLSFVGAYRLGVRLSGRLAGWFAVAGVALLMQYPTFGLRGTSEPLLVCFALWTLIAHLEDRRRLAFWSLVCMSLIRPEAWLFIAGYVVLLWVRDPGARWQLAGGLLLIAAAWTIPPWLSVGDPWSASSHAASFDGQLGSMPAWAVLKRAVGLTVFPVIVGAVVAVGFAIRRRDRLRLLLAALALAWVLIVEVTTLAASYPGLGRFMLPAAALVGVLFGAGMADVAALLPRPAISVAVLVVLSLITAVMARGRISAALTEERIASQSALSLSDLSLLIKRAGGKHALLPCRRSHIAINHTAATALAWKLDVPLSRVKATLRRPGVVLRGRGTLNWGMGVRPQLHLRPRVIHTVARVDRMWRAMSITRPGRRPGQACVGR